MTNSEKLETLIQGALDWAEQGVPVFPCKGDKSPLTANGHSDAATSPDAVRNLFEFFGDEAEFVGAKMGKESGLFAVDLDLYKPGVQEYAEGLQNSGQLPDTRTHRTMRGGLHLLYFGEKEQPNCKPHSGVEVKGEGGYIIVPPSPGYEVLNKGVAEAPQALLDHLRAAKSARSASTDDRLEANILKGDDFHESLVQLAARYAQRGMAQTEVQTKLMATMSASVASSPHHPRHARWSSLMRDQGHEFSRAIETANAKYNVESATAALVEKIDADATGKLAEGLFLPTIGEHEVPTYGEDENPFEGEGYFASEQIDVEGGKFNMWPLFVENESAVMYAEPKTGKTAIALTLGLQIAVGRDLGGLKVPEAGPVLYYALEGPRAIALRVESWKRHEADEGRTVPDHIPMFVVTRNANFTEKDNLDKSVAQIAAYNRQSINKTGQPIKAIFIDTLTRAMAGKDQNSVEDTSLLFDLVGILRSVGVTATVVFIHHKARTGGLRGSTNIEAEPDVLLDISKTGPTVTMKIARARSIEDGQFFHYLLHGYPLGKNSQGYEQEGLYIEPTEGPDKLTSSTDLVVAAGNADKINMLLTLADEHNTTTVDAKQALTAWYEAGLLDKTVTSAPKRVESAKFQMILSDLVPLTGLVAGNRTISRVKGRDNKIASFKVGRQQTENGE